MVGGQLCQTKPKRLLQKQTHNNGIADYNNSIRKEYGWHP